MVLGRELTKPPNLLSLSRVPLGALAWAAPTNVAWLLSLLALAAVTDLLDGWLARRAGESAENFGALLDPLCDKVFIASIAAAVWVALGPPGWLAALALTREGVLGLLVAAKFLVPSLRHRHFSTRALWLGKATTAAQFLLLAAVLLDVRRAWTATAVAAAALGLMAGIQYAVRAVRSLER